jgi:hypothetical protein
VRLRNHDFRVRGNSDLRVEFTEQRLSSYGGLELVRRYFQRIELGRRIGRAFRGVDLAGDYRVIELVMLLLALWLTGGRRLRQIGFLAEDPLVQRLVGLLRLPCDRTVSRFLSRFTVPALDALTRVSGELAAEKLRQLSPRRVTLDFDGTVLTTGFCVKWAFRGYNPHHRYAPSYFPLLCYVAQTGHFLAIKNRPGNIHDSEGALAMIKSAVAQIREILPRAKIEVRLDSAFFQKQILRWLDRNGVEFCVKMPMWKWTGIKARINSTHYWYQYGEDLAARAMSLDLGSWGRDVVVQVIRRKLSDKTNAKKYTQLDLLTPNDGIYEYEVLHTNKKLRPDHLWEFYNGRAAMEHQIGELKQDFALDVIPSREYAANSAWQRIALLAYNVMRNFQLDAGLAAPRPTSQGRTSSFEFQRLRTLRFNLIHVAGRITNTGGKQTLRLGRNALRETNFARIQSRLDRLRTAEAA